MMEIRHILRNRRNELGLTMQEVARAVGVREATVSRWESGNIANMGRDRIASLAKVLQVNPSVIMGWEEEVPPIPGAFPYKPARRIPIVGRVAAGLPVLAEEYIEGYIEIDYKDSGEYFGLRVSGDSMNAANIHDGNILIIRKQPEVENGQIAVVIVNGYDGTVKRYYRNGDMVTLMPQSTNPDHQPQMYNINETEIRIVGKAVENRISLE